jgi:hypothetical protein
VLLCYLSANFFPSQSCANRLLAKSWETFMYYATDAFKQIFIRRINQATFEYENI